MIFSDFKSRFEGDITKALSQYKRNMNTIIQSFREISGKQGLGDNQQMNVESITKLYGDLLKKVYELKETIPARGARYINLNSYTAAKTCLDELSKAAIENYVDHSVVAGQLKSTEKNRVLTAARNKMEAIAFDATGVGSFPLPTTRHEYSNEEIFNAWLINSFPGLHEKDFDDLNFVEITKDGGAIIESIEFNNHRLGAVTTKLEENKQSATDVEDHENQIAIGPQAWQQIKSSVINNELPWEYPKERPRKNKYAKPKPPIDTTDYNKLDRNGFVKHFYHQYLNVTFGRLTDINEIKSVSFDSQRQLFLINLSDDMVGNLQGGHSVLEFEGSTLKLSLKDLEANCAQVAKNTPNLAAPMRLFFFQLHMLQRFEANKGKHQFITGKGEALKGFHKSLCNYFLGSQTAAMTPADNWKPLVTTSATRLTEGKGEGLLSWFNPSQRTKEQTKCYKAIRDTKISNDGGLSKNEFDSLMTKFDDMCNEKTLHFADKNTSYTISTGGF